MNFDKENEAAQYAKAKVQEIRSKIYDPILNKAKHISMIHQARFEFNPSQRRQSREQIQIRQQPKSKPKYHDENSQEYFSRIKNINSINDKIKSALGQIQSNESSFLNKSKPKFSASTANQSTPSSILSEVNKNIQKIKESQERSKIAFRNQQYSNPLELPSSMESTVREANYDAKENLKSWRDLEKPQVGMIRKNDFEENYSKKLKATRNVEDKIHVSTVGKLNAEEVSKQQTQKLAKLMGKQIELDQELKQHRYIFLQFASEEKWNLLLKELKKIQSSLTLEELKENIIISSEEHNPFIQIKRDVDENCIEKLVNSFCKARLFWQEKMDECVEIKKLEKEGFNIQDLDLSRKGYLSIQDLVCFINLYSGNFFRNRDTVTLFKRFLKRGESGIKYENFLQKVTQ